MVAATDPVGEAVREAQRSCMLHRHGAVVVRRGAVVAGACNRESPRLGGASQLFSIHAEVAALGELRKRNPVKGRCRRWLRDCRMYVVRLVRRRGELLGSSRPCRCCCDAIRRAGIPTVFYSQGTPTR
jgi:tRNA(Arg) A34 adenosine deaminase TadA